MAAMSTTLKIKNILGSMITYSLPGHTASTPKFLVQNSQPAVNGKETRGSTLRIVMDAVDPDGNPLRAKDVLEWTIKRAVGSDGANWTGANGIPACVADIGVSDEFVTNFMANDDPVKDI